jgi:rubrerythrin
VEQCTDESADEENRGAAVPGPADNEMEHAKLHFKLLNGIGSTADNLRAAAAGEMDECSEMYPRMAQQAKEEGFPEIAFLFQAIGKIEKTHQERYQKLLEELEAGTIFKQEESARWRCRKCGNIHEGLAAPNVCPVCKHPQGYFELVEDHY